MNIRQEVESAIAAYARANNMTCSFEGVPFNKPVNAPWLEVMFLMSSTMNPTVDGSRVRKTGVFQINTYVPVGKGMKALDSLSDDIVALFPFDRKELYQTFSVEQTPNASQAMIDAGFIWCAVRVKYRQEF
jgi:hypothetical protein